MFDLGRDRVHEGPGRIPSRVGEGRGSGGGRAAQWLQAPAQFVRRLGRALDGHKPPACVAAIGDDVDVVVPRVGGRTHPLSAVYRTSLLAAADRLIAADRMRPTYLFEEARTRFLEEAELLADSALRAADPDLDSLRNLNEPADYEAARALPAPAVRVERSWTLLPAGANSAALVNAATLGAAAAAVGLRLDARVVAALNGDEISRDPDLPLAAGDVVSLMSADGGD